MVTDSRTTSSSEVTPDKPYFCGRLPFIILLILALLGTFASGFLSYRHVYLASHVGAVTESFLCRAGGGISCDAVLLTQYSVLLEFIPSAVLGLAGCIFVLWCTFNSLINQGIRKIAVAVLALYFVAAIGFGWYFMYLMLFEIDHLCPWCMVVHAVNAVSLVTVLVVAVKKRNEFLLPEISTVCERVYFVAGGVLVSLAVFFAVGMVEKNLAFNKIKSQYDELVNDPAVQIARLRASPSYEIPVSKEDPILGSPNAPLSLIVFSDFECPVCAKTDFVLRRIVEANKDVLKLVLKTYPLSTDCNDMLIQNLHPNGCMAARAGMAAFILGGSEAFFAYGELLFKNRNRLDEKPWLEFATELKLDTARFGELLKDGSEADKLVHKDVVQGIELKLSETPIIFFAKKKLPENLGAVALLHTLQELIRVYYPDKKDIKLKFK
ncbi:vitamin K epoxide reductase family protein [Thermodesulfobacteriota bacterium]